jgi:hypothetical protein
MMQYFKEAADCVNFECKLGYFDVHGVQNSKGLIYKLVQDADSDKLCLGMKTLFQNLLVAKKICSKNDEIQIKVSYIQTDGPHNPQGAHIDYLKRQFDERRMKV